MAPVHVLLQAPRAAGNRPLCLSLLSPGSPPGEPAQGGAAWARQAMQGALGGQEKGIPVGTP